MPSAPIAHTFRSRSEILVMGPIASATLRTLPVLGMRLLLQAATLLLLARALGPHGFGVFSGLAALAIMLASVASFGMNTVLLGAVSLDARQRDAVLCYAIPTTSVMGIVLVAADLLLTRLLFGSGAVSMPTAFAIAGTDLLVQPLFGLVSADFQGRGRVAQSQLIANMLLGLRMMAALAVTLLRPTDALAVFAWSYLGAATACLIGLLGALPARWPAPRSWRAATGQELRTASGFAFVHAVATSPSELDKILAARLLPLSAAGIYAAAARVVGAFALPVISMMLAALPHMFRGAAGIGRTPQRLLRTTLAAAFAYSVVLGVGLWFAAPLFDDLFGARYFGITEPLRWLTLAVPGLALRITCGGALMTQGAPWSRGAVELAGLIVLTVAAIALTHADVAHALPLAYAAGETSMATLGLWILSHRKGRPRRIAH